MRGNDTPDTSAVSEEQTILLVRMFLRSLPPPFVRALRTRHLPMQHLSLESDDDETKDDFEYLLQSIASRSNINGGNTRPCWTSKIAAITLKSAPEPHFYERCKTIREPNSLSRLKTIIFGRMATDDVLGTWEAQNKTTIDLNYANTNEISPFSFKAICKPERICLSPTQINRVDPQATDRFNIYLESLVQNIATVHSSSLREIDLHVTSHYFPVINTTATVRYHVQRLKGNFVGQESMSEEERDLTNKWAPTRTLLLNLSVGYRESSEALNTPDPEKKQSKQEIPDGLRMVIFRNMGKEEFEEGLKWMREEDDSVDLGTKAIEGSPIELLRGNDENRCPSCGK